jgi:hypothetical protein
MKIINVFLLALTFIFISSLNSFSFQKADSTEKNGDVLKTRPYAVQFAIGENFVLENFPDLNLSVKKHFSSNFVVRLGFGINLTEQDLSGEQFSSNNFGDYTSKYQRYNYNVQINLLYYINPLDIIKAYVGVGPYFNFGHYYYKDENEVSNSNFTDLTYERRRSTSIGASLLGGIEWFMTSRFSLFAEYNFLYTYSWDDLQYSYRYVSNNGNIYSDIYRVKGNTTSIRGEQLKFGITAYL